MDHFLKSNTDALKHRLHINALGESKNFDQWIIKNIEPLTGLHLLDLGCGSGKQMFSLADLVLPGGSILGVDLSADAISEVKRRAQKEKRPQLNAFQADLDDCISIFKSKKFDKIISSYAIYYSKNMVNLITNLKKLLQPDGEIFICGFGAGSNKELIELINKNHNNRVESINPIENFISNSDLTQVSKSFSYMKICRLNNHIVFRSTMDFMSWWKNHSSYESTLHHLIKNDINLQIQNGSSFILTKNVFGIHLYA